MKLVSKKVDHLTAHPFLVAGFFLLLQAGNMLLFPIDDQLVFYCNNAALLFAIAFLLGQTQFIKGLISVGLFGQLGWSIDIINRFLTGNGVFGNATNFFQGQTLAQDSFSLVLHTCTAVLALVLTYRIRPRPVSLVYSFVYGAILYATAFLFTNPFDDINCVYRSCIPGVLSNSNFYPLAWAVFMAGVIVCTYLLQVWLYKISRKSTLV